MVYMIIRVVVLEVLKCEQNLTKSENKAILGDFMVVRNPIRSHGYGKNRNSDSHNKFS